MSKNKCNCIFNCLKNKKLKNGMSKTFFSKNLEDIHLNIYIYNQKLTQCKTKS